MAFTGRDDAGRQLADRLAELSFTDPVVLALPRGGVPVAAPVAHRLNAPLDLILVRKIGVPGHEEYAAGAVVDGDAPHVVFNPDVLRQLGRTKADFADAVAAKLREIEDRRSCYLAGRLAVPLAGRSAIVIDDGIATGATVKAALLALRDRNPAEIVLAVPVAPHDAVESLKPLVDRLVCLQVPHPFYAVGMHYSRFDQVSDAEVAATMNSANKRTRT